MVAAGLQRIDPGQAGRQIAVRLVEEDIAAAVEAEAGLLGRTGVLHIRQILEEGVRDSVDRAQGCRELDCMVQGYKAPAAAVRIQVVQPVEVLNSRLVAVVRIVVVVHIVAAAAVRIAEVVQATDIHHREDREIACSEACRVGAVLGMESSVVAGRAQQMRRRQPDVLREAYRGRVCSRSWSQ
jgi:hypothetical protein